MDPILYTIIIIVVFAIVLFVAVTFVKKKLLTNMFTYISEKKFKEFEQEVEKGSVKFLFSRYYLAYLKMESSVIEGNKGKINDRFDELLNMNLTNKQREEVVMKAFNYYLSVENKVKCKELLETINLTNNVKMKEEANMTYDIFLMKRHNHIESVLEKMEDIAEENRGVYEYLLSVQYNNKGDKEKAKYYGDLSKKHMEMPVNK